MEPQFLDVGVGAARRRIAVLTQHGPAPKPGLVWLQGFKSDMISTKAAALSQWAAANGRSLTRFDYSGHGQSTAGPGCRFEDGTLGRWIEEARAVFDGFTHGPQILIGSSMGGAIALAMLKRIQVEQPAAAARIKSIVLIAPAWDMTQELMWKQFPPEIQSEVMEKGVWMRPSQYGDPYPITRALIEDGRRHLIAPQGPNDRWNPGRPILIMHGRLDPDVPFTHSERLLSFLDGGHARLTEVPDGEHRLSRPQDIDLLFKLIDDASL